MSRILLVEDEALIALDMVEVLTVAGFQIVGPATDVSEGLKLIEEAGCDAAVLDVNLGKETAAPVAQALRARNIPFVVVSGYTKTQQPAEFGDAPFLPKPVDADMLVRLLQNFTNRT